MPLLARVMAGIAVTATGVGAIPGAIWTLVNVGLSLWTIYDLIDAWWDFQDEEEARDDAEAANSTKPQQDATAATTNTGSGVIPGAPRATAEEAQNLPPIPADVEKILATIRTRESGGNYGAQNPSSTASGAYQFIDGTWNSLTAKYGIGTNYPKAKLAPPEIQDAVAAKYVQEILQQAGGDVSKVPLAWYTGNIQGKSNAVSQAEVARYQREWLNTYTGGQYSGSSYNLQENQGPISGLASGIWDMAKGAVEALAGVAGAGFGPMASRGITDSLVSTAGSASVPENLSAAIPGAPATGGAQATASAINTSDNKAAEISQTSAKIQTALDMGKPKSEGSASLSGETAGQASLRRASSDSKLENIDPNYPGTGGGVDGYLQYYRLAA
jgi:hypothetical protein